MTYKTAKTRDITSIVTSAIIGLMLLSPTLVLPNVNAIDANLSNDCMDKSNKMAFFLASQIDETKARSLAANNSEFASRTSGFDITYGGLVNTWTTDKTTCNPSWDTVSVIYFLGNGTNKYQKNLVFTMDPQLSKITKVDEYDARFQSTSDYSANWSGYEFGANSGHSTTITNAYATFSVPSVSKPTGINCYQNYPTSTWCDMGVWTGLEDAYGATNSHLVQAGTESRVSCDSQGQSCSTTYDAWYEALPASLVICPSFSVSANDAMSVQITQRSGSSSTYDYTINDGGRTCTHTETGYAMTNPTIAPYINERISISGQLSHLPRFTSVSISGTINYGGSAHTIYTPYSNGYYNLKILTSNGQSSGTQLISDGAVGTSGSYTATWWASA